MLTRGIRMLDLLLQAHRTRTVALRRVILMLGLVLQPRRIPETLMLDLLLGIIEILGILMLGRRRREVILGTPRRHRWRCRRVLMIIIMMDRRGIRRGEGTPRRRRWGRRGIIGGTRG